MPRPARREREIAHIREDILRAAAEALGRHGLEKATIHDIAREAGYTTTTLYAYFKGKQDILETLVDRLNEEVEAIFVESGGSPEQPFALRLELLLRRQLDFAERWQAAFVVLARMHAKADPFSAHEPSLEVPKRDHFSELLVTWLRQAATPAELGDRDPVEAAGVLESLGHAIVRHWLAEGRAQPLGNRAQDIANWFLHGAEGFVASGPAAHRTARNAARASKRLG